MNFGTHLREARERRGVSLRQIAGATRISLRTLEALENNEIGKLPGGIFSRAFVRSYAHEVGLDPDETVREFMQQFPLDHVIAGSPATLEGDVARGEEAVRRRQQFGMLVALAIAVPLGAAVIYLLLSARRPASAAADAGEGAGLPGSPPSASVPASAAPAGGPPPPSSSARPRPVVGVGAPPVGAAVGVRPVSATAGGTSVVHAAGPIGASEPLQLRIAPEGPCWVRISADGAVRHQALMQKGEVYTQEARNGFEVLVGDAGTFRFSISGRPGRPLGGAGEVVEARITRASVDSWLQPSRR